jgi:hypothetical protein
MYRVQFIELHEQPWFPDFLRNQIMDALQFGLNFLSIYSPIAPLVQQLLDSSPTPGIVDMCSGGGGPWIYFSRKLQRAAHPAFHVLLTDKFPNPAPFQHFTADSAHFIAFHPSPVDALRVPPEMTGCRTMFTSFHHFKPEDARAILQNAVDAGQGIGIFEITRRAPSTIGLMFVWAFLAFMFTPMIRPFRWSRLFWTYVFPIIPLVLLFDGVISCLRTYRPNELSEIVAKLKASGYTWELGEQVASAPGKVPITFLIGLPQTRAAAD